MNDRQYEYRRFNLDLASVPQSPGYSPMFTKVQIQHLLQPLGDDAWEVTYVKKGWSQEAWVEARRPPYGAPAPSSWEYIGFDLARMPHPQWDHHIASRGWMRIPDVWFEYCSIEWWVYKRTDVWRGSDDGDIMSQLHAFGAYSGGDAHLRFPDKRPDYVQTTEEAVGAILDLKWRRSEQVGHDIGTYCAVKQWIENL